MFVFIWFAAPKAKHNTRITLVQTSGPVLLRNDANGKDVDGNVEQLEIDAQLSAGTIVVDGVGSRAEFAFVDGSTFELSGGSELTVGNGDGKQLFLRRGTMLASISIQPAGHPLVIQTVTAEAVVLGTSFGINATDTETLLQVSSGAVRLRRLSDDQATTVNMNKQIRADKTAGQPLRSEPISALLHSWRVDPTIDSAAWLGEWSDAGILRATPQKVFLKKVDVEESHFHAGVANNYPGLVTLDANSMVRIRYRIDRPRNVGLFISTHAVSWDFTGNFQVYVEDAKTPADNEGWRTATVPIMSFHPMGELLPFQAGCVVSTIYATTWSENLGLEVAELEILSTARVKPQHAL
ncbi:MAG: FecR family protein [Planctomycetaceae bacterium]